MTALWSLMFALPLAVAVLLFAAPAAPRRGDFAVSEPGQLTEAVLRAAPLTVLPALVITVLPGAQDQPSLTVEWLMLGTHLQMDTAARSLLLVTALLYGAAFVAVDWTPTGRRRELTAFLLLCYIGNIGVYLAADTVTFYLSYAVMSFAGYGLVVNSRTDAARRAGRVYIVLTVLSEGAVLAALLLTTSGGGVMVRDVPSAVADSPYTALIVVLVMFGFGVKAGLLPVHVWLPLAHPAAPPAASAVLSGAMVKAGVMGWLRFLPLGEASLHIVGTTLVVLGLAGSVLAVVVGTLQNDPKTVLAYSTISQMGFLAALAGVATAEPELATACFSAAVAYAVHHGLAKGTLFLGVPVWKHHAVGARRWPVIVGLVGAGLAVAGAPLSSGAVGKYAAKNAVDGHEVLGLDLTMLLPFVATCSTLLLLRFGALLVAEPAAARGRGDAELGGWLLLVASGIVVPWAITAVWLPASDVPGLDAVTFWEAAWPIGLGVGIAALAVMVARWNRMPARVRRADGTLIPPGDLVVPATWLVRFVRRAVSDRAAPAGGGTISLSRVSARLGNLLDDGESIIVSRIGSGLVLLVIVVVVALAGGAS